MQHRKSNSIVGEFKIITNQQEPKMSPKRNKLKSATLANVLLLGCITLGTAFAQGSISTNEDSFEEIINDDQAVQLEIEKALAEEAEIEIQEAEAVVADETMEDTIPLIEEAIAEEAPVEEVVAEEAPIEEIMAEELAADDTPVEAVIVEEEPIVEEPAVVEVVVPKTSIEESEIARRSGLQFSADEIMKQAQECIDKKDYKGAISHYNHALNELDSISNIDVATLEKKEKVQTSRGAAYNSLVKNLESEAKKSLKLGDIQTTTATLEEAVVYNPDSADQYRNTIKELEGIETLSAYYESIKAKNVDSEKETRDSKIKYHMERAKLLMRNRQFDDAKRELFSVLRLETLNREARVLYTKIQKEVNFIGLQSKKIAREEAMNQVTWQWSTPVPKVDDAATHPIDSPIEKPHTGAAYLKMQDKLDTIIIQNLDFKEANILDVIDLLDAKSKSADKKYHEGVNIITMINLDAGSSVSADDLGMDDLDSEFEDDFADTEGDDFGDDFGDDLEGLDDLGGASGGSSAIRTVTFKIERMTLREVLEYVCAATGLKMRVDKNAIVIASELEEKNLQTRYYNVREGFIKAISDMGSTSGSSANDEDDFGFDEEPTSSGSSADSASLIAGFKTLGITFSSNAAVSYSSHISKLIVTNTAENLNKVQEVINQLDTGRPLINIEAKFVEVIQTDLEELGFEWMITSDINHGELYIPGSKSKPQNLTGGLSSLSDFMPDVVAPGQSDILTSYVQIGGTEVKNVIRALDQKRNTDVLFSPEVTTLSGIEAVLKSITTRYFPENWTEPEPGNSSNNNDNGGSGGNATPSVPEFGDPTELGVTLSVTPSVTPGSREIELDMAPKVTSFVQYDEEIQIPFDGGVTYSPKMPIIEERSVVTKVICDDGETIVLGGLMKEKIISFEDRVPLLADIPLFGKLFTSEGEASEKANLLIFVTAKLVDSAGREIKDIGRSSRENANGLPKFHH